MSMVDLAQVLRNARLPRYTLGRIVGFEEDDLSSLEGLSEEDLDALDELKDLSAEDLEELKGFQADPKDEAIDKLKEALHKERVERRRLAKELKAAGAKPPAKKATNGKGGKGKDADEEDEESSDSADKEELQRERQRSEKLAERFATNAVDTTILRVMGSGDKKLPRFQDSDDVLKLISRDMIDVDQEDDEPDKVEVDEDTVKDALKRLAKSKPHLLVKEKEEGGEEEESGGGSRFGGGRRPKSAADRRKELVKKYPALGKR